MLSISTWSNSSWILLMSLETLFEVRCYTHTPPSV